LCCRTTAASATTRSLAWSSCSTNRAATDRRQRKSGTGWMTDRVRVSLS
jgi:hypothetical protein